MSVLVLKENYNHIDILFYIKAYNYVRPIAYLVIGLYNYIMYYLSLNYFLLHIKLYYYIFN